jgi:hypothetical protein
MLKQVASEFRPISLCSYFLKSLERLVLWNIESTTLTADPLSSAQHAFRRDYSTDTALTAVVNKLEQGLLNQKITLAVYLDISGAFNNLSFDSALSALRRKKIPEHLVKWYSSFLHNQCSTLTIDNKNFTRALTKGTPQGGVLSPIVWNIIFDEILKKLDQKPIKTVGFADDSVLLITGIDPSMMVYMIQPALNDIVAWGHESGLEFNASKTMVSWYTNNKTEKSVQSKTTRSKSPSVSRLRKTALLKC